jgi:hypothetical protein
MVGMVDGTRTVAVDVAIAYRGPRDVVIVIWAMRRLGDAKASGGQR